MMVSILNTIAIFYGSTTALPVGSIMLIVIIYMFVAVPLFGLGGVIGYYFRSEFQAPCVTKRCIRDIPPLAWYRKTPGQMFIGGLLPFSAIVLELHHLYASLWGFKIYTLYGVLFIMFVVLIMLTTLISIGLTYIQLYLEDHDWWWRSVLRGDQQLFSCLAIASSITPKQIWGVSCNYYSSLATMLSCAMHFS